MTRLRKVLRHMMYLTAGLFLLSGCIEEYEADIAADDVGLLVVEGTICSDRLNTFYLSRTQPLNAADATPQHVIGATVTVCGSDGMAVQAQDDNGCYSCQLGRLSDDVEYYLHIEADGEVYESTPQRPLRTEKIADVKVQQETPNSSLDILITPEAPFNADKTNYYLWTYDETWQVYPDYYTIMYFDTEKMEPVFQDIYHFPRWGWIDDTSSAIMIATSSGYESNHIQQLKLYDIDRGDIRVYHRYSSMLHQRAITKAEYEYESARRQAGSEMGGLFTPLPSALPSNIRCLTSGKHVIGYVGCSLNTSDYRFFINAAQFSIHHPAGIDGRQWLVNPTMEDCAKMVAHGLYLCEWHDPEQSIDNKLHTAWAYLHQLDVRERYKGAYIEEPDFWSLTQDVSY